MKKIHRIKWFFLSNIIYIFVIAFLVIKILGERTIEVNSNDDSIRANIGNFKEIEVNFIGTNDESQGDDSLSPEYKDIIELRKDGDGRWQIIDQKSLWKCQPGRGHQNFSTGLCI